MAVAGGRRKQRAEEVTVADYGPAESVSKEGWALLLFVGGLCMWVAGFAYADEPLQAILAVLGFGLDIYAFVMLAKAKREGRAKSGGEAL
jgi:hypothetical protein